MFFELLIFMLLGIVFGILTGLMPGIHINLVAAILLSVSPFLLQYFNILSLAAFIIAMSITHTFLDFIPSIYLGAPSEDTALAVLPGHKLLLRGMAHEAIRLTTIGGLLCLLFSIALIPILVKVVPFIYNEIKEYIEWVLLFVVIYMILKSKELNKIFWTAVVFLFSGIFGIIVFGLNLKEPLLPMFSGLFGTSMLIKSITENVTLPLQRTTEMIKILRFAAIRAIAASTFSGIFITLFPGLGPAQAAVLGSQIVGRIGMYSYLLLVGGINTVSMLASLVTLYTIEKARNGSIAVVQKMIDIDFNIFLTFITIALIAGFLSTILSISISKGFSNIMNKLDYRILCICIIALIILIVIYFSGILGVIVLLTATFIGIMPTELNIPRSTLMASLLLPIILWYLV